MKLEIEVPDMACCRCGTVAGASPLALKRGHGPGEVTDSEGQTWVPAGITLPTGWSTAPTDTSKYLCAPCAPIVAAKLEAALAPDLPALPPPKSASASIPTHAPKIIGPTVRTSPTPAQAAARVTGGAFHGQQNASRPMPTIAAAPSIVQPPTVNRPTPGAAPRLATTPSVATVGVQMVRPNVPNHKAEPVMVASNTSYPQPKSRVIGGVPQMLDRHEQPVLDNETAAPQQPDNVHQPILPPVA